MNEIFLDIETTGLSVKDNHKIVEIACVETRDLIPTKKVFHKYINPERDVSEDAYNIHGFSYDFLKDKETFNQIADNFIDFIKGKKIIIHNASFDLGFLNHELKLTKKLEINRNLVIDSLEFARSKFPGASNSLDALCRKFNIDLSRRTKHNALLDCELLREVYINLIGAKEPKLDFSTNNLDNSNKINSKKNIAYSKKIIELTEDEKRHHSNFLKKELKKNYF